MSHYPSSVIRGSAPVFAPGTIYLAGYCFLVQCCMLSAKITSSSSTDTITCGVWWRWGQLTHGSPASTVSGNPGEHGTKCKQRNSKQEIWLRLIPMALDFGLYKPKDCYLYKTVSQAQQRIYILITPEILSSRPAGSPPRRLIYYIRWCGPWLILFLCK